MVKHNNQLPNVHLRKWWQRYVKTWLNQPGRKQSRRKSREIKRAKAGVRPLDLLRPGVHPPTQRYNMCIRKGKGFTLEELKAAGISPRVAMSIGISVDHRRQNRCKESFELNVNRLKNYRSKLVLFPRGSKPKKGGGGVPADSSKKDLKKIKNENVKNLFPLPRTKNRGVEARAITEEMKEFYAYRALRKALREAKTVGRKKAATEEAI